MVYLQPPSTSHPSLIPHHTNPPLTTPHLAADGSRARVGIRGRCRPVKLEQNARVGSLVSTGEGHQLAGVEGARAARDGDLGAGEVELGTTDAAGRVESDVLNTEEVLAVGDAAGDLDRDLGLACWVKTTRLVSCL